MGVYQRGEIWWVRFQFRGEKVNESAHTTSRKEAEEYERELRERKRSKYLGLRVDLPLAEAIADYIEHVRAGREELKESSIDRYETSFVAWKRFIESEDPSAMISSVDKRWVAKFVRWRQDAGRKNATIRRDLDALSNVFEFLQTGENPCVDRNFVRDYNIASIPEKRDEIRVPKTKEIQKLIDSFGPMVGRLIAFQAITGLRQGEARRLERDDIELDLRRLIVTKSKSSRPRTVKLFDSAIEIYRSIPKPPKGDFVFWHDDGDPYAKFSSDFRDHANKLGLTSIRNHDMRHFYAWLYLRRGGSLEGLKIQLGHTTKQVTELYGHLAADLAHLDLIRMGEPVAELVTNFDVSFSFAKCGSDWRQKHPGWPKKDQ